MTIQFYLEEVWRSHPARHCFADLPQLLWQILLGSMSQRREQSRESLKHLSWQSDGWVGFEGVVTVKTLIIIIKHAKTWRSFIFLLNKLNFFVFYKNLWWKQFNICASLFWNLFISLILLKIFYRLPYNKAIKSWFFSSYRLILSPSYAWK